MIELLEKTDTNLYWRAINFLTTEEAIPSLCKALNNNNENIRGTIAYILGEIGETDGIISELEKLLEDSSPFVLKRVMGSLMKLLGEDSIIYLKRLVHHSDASVRGRIATHLGELKSKKGLKTLIILLKDTDKSVQKKAAISYRIIKPPKEEKKPSEIEKKKVIGDEDTSVIGKVSTLEIQIQDLIYIAFTNNNFKKRKKAVKQLLKFAEQTEDAKKFIIQNILKDKEATSTLVEEDTMHRKQTLMELMDFSLIITTSETVEILLEALVEEEDSRINILAEMLFKQIHSPASIPILLQALEDEQLHIKRLAVEILSRFDDSRLISPFITLLNSDDDIIKLWVIDALGRKKVIEALKPLLSLLNSDNYKIIRKSLSAIANIANNITDEQVISSLILSLEDLIKHPEMIIRRELAYSLGKIGTEKTILLLLKMLKDESAKVRAASAGALGIIASESALEELSFIIDTDTNSSVRRKAARAVGNIGGEKAKECLITKLSDKDPWIVFSAAEVLAYNTGSQEAIGHLISFLESKDSLLREEAIQILVKTSNNKSIEKLFSLLSHSNRYVWTGASKALAKIANHNEIVIEYLFKLTNDIKIGNKVQKILELISNLEVLIESVLYGDNSIYSSLIELLKQRDLEKVGNLLTPYLSDEDEEVRKRTAMALSDLGDMSIIEPLIRLFLVEAEETSKEAIIMTMKNISSENSLILLLKHFFREDNYDTREQLREVLKYFPDEPKVKQILPYLLSEDEALQQKANEILKDLSYKVIEEALINILKSDDREILKRAVIMLGEISSEKAIPYIIRYALRDKDSILRETASQVLRWMQSDNTITYLSEAMQDRDYLIRREILTIASSLPEDQSVSFFIDCLKDENDEIRKVVAEVLSQINTLEATRSMLSILDDENAEIRRIAVSALGNFATIEILKLLQQILFIDCDIIVRRLIAQLLIEKNYESTLKIILIALEDSDNEIRREASEFLYMIISEDIVRILEKIAIYDSDIQVRRNSALALANLNDNHNILELLPNALNDESAQIRQYAIEAIGLSKTTYIIPLILDALNDKSQEVICAAIIALGRLQAREAVEPLLKLLYTDLPKAHYHNILYALKKIMNKDDIILLKEMRENANESFKNAINRLLFLMG